MSFVIEFSPGETLLEQASQQQTGIPVQRAKLDAEVPTVLFRCLCQPLSL